MAVFPIARTFLALAGVMIVLASGSALAQSEINVGEMADPVLAGADAGLEDTRDVVPAPAAPAIDVAQILLRFLREMAYTVVVGLAGGEAGSEVGTPDAVGAEIPGMALVDGVALPATGVDVPGREVPLGTPPVGVDWTTPAIVSPGLSREVPGVTVPIAAPGVAIPGIDVGVPPQTIWTPAVATPPVRVETPPLAVPGNDVAIDIGGLGVGFQGARGVVYLGPVVVPYEVPATRVTLDDLLPPEAPREVALDEGAIADVPRAELVDEPGRTLLASQPVTTPGVSQHVDGRTISEPVAIGEVGTDPAGASVPSRVLVPSQRIEAGAPGTSLGAVDLPGASAGTEGVEVSDVEIATPGATAGEERPVPVDDLGYFGYGRGSDSSLYPYACAAGICVDATGFVRPWVRAADDAVDTIAAFVDGPIVVGFELMPA